MMKNILLILSVMLLISGCTSTVHGIQEDSKQIWDNTKETIHDATAP